MQKKKFMGEEPLYLQVAEGLEKLIGNETLRIGDKLPSVRMLSEEYGISMGTAFQAYYHLEGKGLIESRPKSGYYVRFNLRRMPGLPRIAEPELVAEEVSVQDIVASACMEALATCLKATTKPGDTVAIDTPTYFGIFQAIESLGLKALEIAADPVTGIDPDHLANLIRKFPVKACVFVPNFSNPLGSCMPDEKKADLVKLITRHRIPLIEDDIYGEMYFGRHRPRTCKSFDEDGWVLYCSSLSKSLAPGYRIGWTLAGRFTQRLVQIKMMHTVSGTTLTQQAMAHFLSIGRYEYHLKKLRKALHTQCLRYLQGIMQYFPKGTKVSRPLG